MTEMTSEERREIIEAIQGGRKLKAIKLYRDATGSDLLESKTFIESLQQTLTSGEVVDDDGQSSLSDDQRNKIVELLQTGKKIEAVKVYRDATGSGLRESKESVESIGRENGIANSNGSGCGAAVLALLVVALVFAAT